MLKRIFFGILACMVLGAGSMASATSGVPLPELYPAVQTTTSLIVLDDSAMQKAKSDRLDPKQLKKQDFVRKSDELWIAQSGYYLGYKAPSFISGKTPASYGIITPYSAARYVFYKTEANFQSVSPDVVEQMKQYKNIAYVAAFILKPGEDVWGKREYHFVNVVIKKGDTVYQHLPKERYLPRFMTFIGDEDKIWPFPIDLFTGDQPIEIIGTEDGHSQRRWTITPNQFAVIQ